jgi:hypothetical protein
VELESGLAVRVTWVPWSNRAEQVVPQSIPVGEEVTVPEPAPERVTESVWRVTPASGTPESGWSPGLLDPEQPTTDASRQHPMTTLCM